MKKDVIYIDVEDDITAIIGKVKAATAKIVALVPPKRTGVLQSAVNLKLLRKSAIADDKRIVLITGDNLLTSLAAGIKMPVAKNLQSRPEIPIIPALEVDNTDVINGEELPVGDIAAAAGMGAIETDGSNNSTADAISEQIDFADTSSGTHTTSQAALRQTTSKRANLKFDHKIKVPNFDSFRKKLFLISIALVAVVAFLYWALVIAPTAMITITAKTNSVSIERALSLQPSLSSSQPAQLQLKPTVKQLQKTVSVTFTPTGTQNVGNKAAGTITIQNCDYANGFTLPAGTNFTSAGGQVFVSTQAVTVPQFTGPASNCTLTGATAGTATVPVQANDIGPGYNIAAQNYTFPQTGNVGAVGSAMTGGTENTVTVVSQDDVNKAAQQLTQQSTSAIEQQLKQEFGSDQLIINESFTSVPGTPTPTPAVGQQGTQATLSEQMTYSLVSISRSDVHQILTDYLNSQLSGQSDQSIFNAGDNTVQFQAFQMLSDGSYTVRLTTTGYTGTTINTSQLAQQIKGKQYGEIQALISAIPGVDKVDISLSPFWVTSAPNNTAKIKIRFTVTNGG